ncbi:Vacuolar protein sorting-associated protein 51 [Glycine soja]
MNTHKTPLDDKTRRTRHLLVSFYSPIPLASSNPFSKHTSSDDINSTSFQPDQFMNNLARNSNLEDVLITPFFILVEEQFIYDLPDKLGMCIKSEDYANAVKFYTGAMPIFKVKNLKTKLLDKLELSLANIHFIPKIMDNASPCTHEELASSFSRRSVLGYEYGLSYVLGEISKKFWTIGEKFLQMLKITGNEVKQVLPQDMRKHHRVDSSESTASSRSNSFGDEKLSRSNNIQKGRNQQLLETRLAKLFKQKS